MDIGKLQIPGLKVHQGIRIDSRVYVYEGFGYIISKTKDDSAYLTCRRKTCAGFAVINKRNNKATFTVTKPHTHEEENKFIKIMTLRHHLRVEAMKDTKTSLKKIFDAVVAKYGPVSGVDFRSVVTSMNRARQKSKSNPTMIDYDAYCEDENDDLNQTDENNEEEIEATRDEENVEEQASNVIEELPDCTVDLERIKIERIFEENNAENENEEEAIPDQLTEHEIISEKDNRLEDEIEAMDAFDDNTEEDAPILKKELTSSLKKKQINLRDCNIMGCELVDGLLSTCGSQVIIYDNYIYIVKKMTEDIIDLKCFKQTCPGTGVVFLNEKLEGIVKLKKGHNHESSNITIKLSAETETPKKRKVDTLSFLASNKRTRESSDDEAGPSGIKKRDTRKNKSLKYNKYSDEEDEDYDMVYDDPTDADFTLESGPEPVSKYRTENVSDNLAFLKTCSLPGVTIHDDSDHIILSDRESYSYRINKRRGDNFYLRCRVKSCGISTTLRIVNKVGKLELGAREHNHDPDHQFLNRIKKKITPKFTSTPKNLPRPKFKKESTCKRFKEELFDVSDDNDESYSALDPRLTISSGERLKNSFIPDVAIYEGLRTNSFMLVHKDFSYRIKNRRGDSFYLECRLPKCGATATVRLKFDEGQIVNVGKHRHAHDLDYIKTIKFRQNLRDEARRCPGIPAKQLIDKVLARYGGEGNFDVDSYRRPVSEFSGRGRKQSKTEDDDNDSEIPVQDISHVEEIDNDDTVNENEESLPTTYHGILKFLKACELPGIELIEGLRPNSLVFSHGDYIYRIKNRRRSTLYLICRLDSCSSTAVLNIKDKVGNICLGSRAHNHGPDDNYKAVSAFKTDLRNETRLQPGAPGRQIYETVIARHDVKLKYRDVEAMILRAKHRKDKQLSYSRIAEEALADETENAVSKIDMECYDSFDDNDFVEDDTVEKFYHQNGEEVDEKMPLGCDNFNFRTVPYKSIPQYFPGIEFYIGFRCNGQIFTYNNYAYTVSKTTNKAMYLRCRLKKCHGTASLTRREEDGEFIFKMAQQHNHDTEEQYINTLKFRQDLRNETINHSNLSSRDLFNRVSKSHQTTKRGNINYSSIQSLLTRLRKKIDQQPNVRTLNDLSCALQTPEWSSFGESYHVPDPQPWYRGVRSAPDGTKMAVFINEWMVRNIKNLDPIILHIDVSYATRPEVFRNHHVLTCHIVFFNKVFAFGFFIMNRKSSIGYRKCFEMIQEYAGQLEPKTVLSDYEPALHAAVRIFWPQTNIMGCYYHFVQSIVKEALANDKLFVRDTVKRRIVKHYLSMPLIPPEYIANGHVIINRVIAEEHLENEFCYLDDFFGQYWMDSIGAETFSVYGINNTLNDSVDMFHQRMKHSVSARTTAWSFIDALRGLSHNEEADFIEGLEAHDKIVGQLVVQKKQEKEILKAQKELIKALDLNGKKKIDSDPDTVIESAIATFLIRMSDVLDPMLDRESQEPKQSRLTRPRRKLVSTNISHLQTSTSAAVEEKEYDDEEEAQPIQQNELMEVLNNMAEQLYVVQDEDGNIISYVKPEPKSPEPVDEEEMALADHDYYIEVVCDGGEQEVEYQEQLEEHEIGQME